MSRSQDNEYLKIGDFVSFKSVLFNSYMSAEGILLEDVNVSNDLRAFGDCIFCIHLQRKYSASRELENYLTANKIDVANIEDEHTLKYFQALERGRDNENGLNDAYLRNKLGDFVLFGDVVQLFHVKSRKYLRVCPDQLAKGERENLRVALHDSGDAYSWIQINPRYKIDREGDRIPTNSEMYLCVLEKTGEYLHCADRSPYKNNPREVNCALEPCSWRLSIFQSSLDAMQQTSLLASQVVYINDPEKSANLSIATRVVESFDDDATVETGYAHEYGDVVLEPFLGDVSSNSLWVLESKKLVIGGPIQWKTDTVRIKHINTGQYLLHLRSQQTNEDGDMKEASVFTVTTDGSLPGTLFSINELNGTSNLLSVARPVQLSQKGIVMESSSQTVDRSFLVKWTTDTNKAINFKVFRYQQQTDAAAEEEEVEEVESEDGEPKKYADPDIVANGIEPLDVNVGVAARSYLKKYLDMVVVPKRRGSNSIWPEADKVEVDLFHTIVERTTMFVEGFSISATNVDLDVDKGDAVLRTRRQDLIREQGLLEYILRIIHRLIPLGARAERNNAEDQQLIEMSREVVKASFQLLLSAVKDNAANQMFVADHMPVLLSHLGWQPLAGRCTTEMLANNIELQENKIGIREIKIFVDRIRISDMKLKASLLALLKACCSCQAEGVDANQFKVTNLLFLAEDAKDMLATLHADYSRVSTTEWGEDSRYIPYEPLEQSPVLGESLIISGSPLMSLSWKSASEATSSYKLFGKDQVGLLTLYRPNNGIISAEGWAKRSSRSVKGRSGSVLIGGSTNFGDGQSNAEEKAAVAEFFIAQMLLAAEMCMDRNYIAMHTLDNMFPYEVLVAMMKLEVSENLQAAAARLLFCLHIDRDPQAETKIPCLTRPWGEVKASLEGAPKLPCVEAGRINVFALVQQILSDHVHEMAGKRWDGLSREYLMLLRKLVSFNFYGTQERMEDLIAPLINALDRRQMDSSEGFTKTSKLQSDEIEDEGEMSLDKGEESVEKEVWQKGVLEFLESFRVMCAILTLVAAAVAVTVYQTVLGTDPPKLSPLGLFGIIVLFIFVCEISLRLHCFLVVKDTLWAFVKNPFNQIDIFVILIDIVFLSMPDSITSKGGSVKTLRLVRLIRLLRVLRAARVVQAIAANLMGTKKEKWKIPKRYTRATETELSTIVEAMTVLERCHRVIEDRSLTLFLRYFHLWESGADTRSPSELFEQIIQDSAELSLGVENFRDVFVDLLMYTNMPLVQGAMEILMAHYCTRKTLLEHAKEVQLMVSGKQEKMFGLVDRMLLQLERNAETQELWGELKTESDLATNEQTKDILKELIGLCRVRREVLEFDKEFEPNVEIQNLYRNQSCFPICMKVLDLLESIEDDTPEDVVANTKEICLLGSTLLYWFVVGNPQNQELCFENIDFFLDTLDEEINSHVVIEGMLEMNEKLIKLVPHRYLEILAEKITKAAPDERSPADLFLFKCITHVEDRNVKENQLEIMKQLTSPGRLESVASFFVPITHPDYQPKRELMAPFLGQRDVAIDDLPHPLAYHLTLMDVLSRCTVGRYNITTVEAKVQSIFKFKDVIDSILDPGTIPLLKIHQSLFLFNAVIDVEMSVPGLEYSATVWSLLESYVSTFSYAKDELRVVEKSGWEVGEVCRQQVEWIVICAMIVNGFFSRYYKKEKFRLHDGGTAEDRLQMTMLQINELITSLFRKIRDVYEMDSPRLSQEQKMYFYKALCALNDSASAVIVTEIKMNDIVIDTDALYGAEQDHSLQITRKYNEFLRALEEDEGVKQTMQAENADFMDFLSNIPKIDDEVTSDVRREVLFKKLVGHVRENLVVTHTDKSLNPRATAATIWLIRGFRTMIELRMGMTIDERDEAGGEEQDIAAAPVIEDLLACGAVPLCIDLVAVGIDEDLQLEAMRLCVGMLFKEGGAKQVQQAINSYLRNSNSFFFFKQLHLTLQRLVGWHGWRGVFSLEEGAEPDLPDDIIAIRFMQLMSEGHYLPNQDIMREQPHNHLPFNLLDDYVYYLNALSKLHCRTSTCAASHVCSIILEVIQGPCPGNQTYFCLETDLLEVINRLLRSRTELDCVEEEELELKTCLIKILQGLLEGQSVKSVVYERILSVMHLDIVAMLSGSQEEEEDEIEEEFGVVSVVKEVEAEEISEELGMLRSQCLIFLFQMCDSIPSLRQQIKLKESAASDNHIVSVEVMWNGLLQRRFFHVPALCHYMAKSSMDTLLVEVERSNLETQLVDFQHRVHKMYREVQHQKYLTDIGISAVFSQQNHSRATWTAFSITCLINLLYLSFYTHYDGTHDDANYVAAFLPPAVDATINAFNYIQLAVAAFTLLQSLVVRTPLVYQGFRDEGCGILYSIASTIVEPYTIYYSYYVIFVCLGIVSQNFFISFLLLDIIVKNSTTKNVLMAVYQPRGALFMAAVVGIIIMYIYSIFTFSFFYQDQAAGDMICYSLHGCFKFYLGYGLRAGGGIGDNFVQTLRPRAFLDVTFFLVVTIALLNIIFGITIDTFSALRFAKDERIEKTEEFCFMCGIEKLQFDRAALDGFSIHTKDAHCLWNYLKFIIFLWEQDRDDDDGLELYVRSCIETGDITWFPMNKAMTLRQKVTQEEILQTELVQDIAACSSRLEEKLSNMQSETGIVLSQLKQAMAPDSSSAEFGIISSTKHRMAARLSSIIKAAGGGQRDTRTAHSKGHGHNVDDQSLSSQESLATVVDRGKHVSITIVEVSNLNLPESDLLTVVCRVMSETNIYAVKCGDVFDNGVTFSPQNLLVGMNAMDNDKRQCQVQVLLQPEIREIRAKFLGTIEISLSELIAATERGLHLCKPLQREGEHEVEGGEDEDAEPCTVTISPSYEIARRFGVANDHLDSLPGGSQGTR